MDKFQSIMTSLYIIHTVPLYPFRSRKTWLIRTSRINTPNSFFRRCKVSQPETFSRSLRHEVQLEVWWKVCQVTAAPRTTSIFVFRGLFWVPLHPFAALYPLETRGVRREKERREKREEERNIHIHTYIYIAQGKGDENELELAGYLLEDSR